MMKNILCTIFSISTLCLTGCASGYKLIQPNTINYISTSEQNGIKLSYKYDLLHRKYAKKEIKKSIKVVAIKLTNYSDRDLMLGRDLKLTFENGNEVVAMDNAMVYKSLKQSPATHLLYLLLTPLNLYISTSDGDTSSTPIGLILGPGIAAGNVIAASNANKKFKTELLNYEINGTLIKKGETKYGLIGIHSNSFEALRIRLE